MALLKLNCANCSAPLEIGDDLTRFTCSYCGTPQIVERAGGIVALKKVQSAIHAVQRGTDRTAAELAMPRLANELAQAQDAKLKAVAAAKEVHARALSGRRQLTVFVALALFFLGMPMAMNMPYPEVGLGVWLIAQFALPIYVYRKVKIPKDTTQATAQKHDAEIARIQAHIKANREILDALPT